MYAIKSHEPHWSRNPSELMAAMGTSARGLASGEAADRLRRHGENTVQDQTRVSALRLLLRQFESPLVLILVIGGAISLVLHDWVEASIILAIVVGSTLLGFVQEYRASAATSRLRVMQNLRRSSRKIPIAGEHPTSSRPHSTTGTCARAKRPSKASPSSATRPLCPT